MTHRLLGLAPLLALTLAVACGGGADDDPRIPPVAPERTVMPLDAFVADTTGYSYEVLWTGEQGRTAVHVLDVTSQVWRTSEEVDRIEWWHDVAIAIPPGGASNPPTVVISGGRNGSRLEPGDSELEYLALIANLTRRPAVGIGQIPNQPLTIHGQGGPRTEDHLVAATWDRALATGDPTWSAYFPMTRAVVRCLDAVQDYMASLDAPVEGFVVTGYSKRGATTWLVGAVDPRVVAMAPGVFDFLHFAPQATHHLAAYGAPAEAVAPYAAYGLLDKIDDPGAEAIVGHSDPYVYRDRLTMPKLLLHSPGDQFFLPDAGRYYLDDLPGETLVRYIPNTDHSLMPPNADVMTLALPVVAWQGKIRDGTPRPSLDGALEGDTLTLRTSPAADEVKLWQATNPAARDFRRQTLGAAWTSTPVEATGGATYVASVAAPPSGWTAFFLEARFGLDVYTTRVYVTPDTYPE